MALLSDVPEREGAPPLCCATRLQWVWPEEGAPEMTQEVGPVVPRILEEKATGNYLVWTRTRAECSISINCASPYPHLSLVQPRSFMSLSLSSPRLTTFCQVENQPMKFISFYDLLKRMLNCLMIMILDNFCVPFLSLCPEQGSGPISFGRVCFPRMEKIFNLKKL